MSYTKHNFKSKTRLTAVQLNEMDEQIAQNEAAIASISGGGSPVFFIYDAERRGMSITGVTFEGRIRYIADRMLTNAKVVLDAIVPDRSVISGLRIYILSNKQKNYYVHNQVTLVIASAVDHESLCGKILRWKNDGSYQAPPPNTSYDAILDVGDALDAIEYDDATWSKTPLVTDTIATVETAGSVATDSKASILGNTYDGTGKIIMARLCGKSTLVDKQVVMMLFTGGTTFTDWKDGFVVRKSASGYEICDPTSFYDAITEIDDQYIITEIEV